MSIDLPSAAQRQHQASLFIRNQGGSNPYYPFNEHDFIQDREALADWAIEQLTALISDPIRVQRQRTAGWRMPPNTIYVGRPTIFGNPWTVEWCKQSGLIGEGYEAETVVANYRAWLTYPDEKRLQFHECFGAYEEQRAELMRRLPELRGKNLACWCSLGQECHADVLLEIANR